MKKISICVVMLFISCSLFAQVCPQFKGHTVEGNIYTFEKSLEGQGFTKTGTDKEPSAGNVIIKMQGTYAGYKDCDILLFKAIYSDNILSVRVVFPISDEKDFSTLETQFTGLELLMIEKYGASFSSNKEYGLESYESNKLRALSKSDQGYFSAWGNTDNCVCILELYAYEYSYSYYGNVRIEYDNLNAINIDKKQASDDM